ncbi:MAG: RNA polymerase sigma factor [Opitutaceae bacterium]|nr:RNA polymerase sigma factor [Opitutaceae bacterium]
MPPCSPEQARWFAEHVLPHESALRAWLQARFQYHVDVDDVVQESYMRLLRVQATGPVANPRAFLFVSARNFALNQIRRFRRERRNEDVEVDTAAVFSEVAGISEALIRAEDLRFLIQAIQALPNRCREIMTLRKIYGFSQREVAMKLGITENTVETQSRIGLRKCAEFFRRHGYQLKGGA